ncbi:hypothetical protein [Anaerolinea sp.]|uniref:hypothetical protein n=1 Tax=Anaerolinea sp. TaxID=1872519 RepID=UPI002ACD3DBC|nr:hypothetical protein [Anaerolinea sp.]
MAGGTLAEQQAEQAGRISDEMARQSIEHQQALQASAEKRWKVAHEGLVEIVRSLDSDYYDACQKSGHAIEGFDDETLHHWIIFRVKSLQTRLSQTMRPDNSSILQSQLDEAIRKIEDLQKEEKRLREIIGGLQAENRQLTTHLHAIRQVQRPAIPQEESQDGQQPEVQQEHSRIVEAEPDWMKEWRSSRTFAKESAAIILMGETGKCLRPSLVDLLAKKLNLSANNSSLSETFNRLINFDTQGGLIELLHVFEQIGASTGGNRPDILRLTERGQQVYQWLTGKVPVENEYERLVRRHKTPEHTLLNIQAAEELVDVGRYQVTEQAPDIHLPDGSLFIPDLVALDPRTGEMIFVEVERQAGKDRAARVRKWKNVLNATNGNIYVVCDNVECQRAIQTEINQTLGDARFNSHLTNINSLRNGKRGQDGSIWLSVWRGR